jgi:molecular chaperone GrpE
MDMEKKTNKEEALEDVEVLEDQEFEGIDEEQIASLEGLLEELQSSNKKLVEENTKLENEANAYKEKLLRLNAEYDNYRKRTAKEKEGIYTDACEDVLKNMFPVLDNLERAATVNGSAEDIKKGIEMTIRQFKDSLQKLLVEEIPTTEGFDPNFHDAVMHVEDSSVGEKAIVEVFQKGYKRGDKVLRHSMVKVAN